MKELECRIRVFGDRPAIHFESETVSYRELNSRIQDLSTIFNSTGINSASTLAVCIERGDKLVTALLTCFLHDIPFVLINPEWDKTKQDELVEVVGATHLLGPTGIIAKLNPRIVQRPIETAYFATSSGTSGQMKCAMVPRAGLEALMINQSAALNLRLGERVLQFANPGYDAIISEVFTSLWAGVELFVLPGDHRLILDRAIKLIASGAIESVTLTPSVARTMGAATLKKLRKLILAGEVADVKLVEPLLGVVELYNAYGPCETTCCTHVGRIMDRESVACIGAPLEHISAELVEGEMWIHGPAVGFGYVGMEDDRSFGFCPQTGQRHYKTGDLFSVDQHGRWHFLGRNDSQIKIRGQKVSLVECQRLVEELVGVGQCAVISAEIASQVKIGVFYSGDFEPDNISKVLKTHMMGRFNTAKVFKLASLPLNENGKINRKYLVDQFVKSFESRVTAVSDLASIWCAVIGAAEVQGEDNFFEQGGDSLAVITLLCNVEEHIKRPLDIAQFLENPTFDRLAAMSVSSENLDREKYQNPYLDDLAHWSTVVQEGASDDVLLTGVTGRLGAKILEALLNETAFDIWCLGRGDANRIPTHSRVHWVSCDLADSDSTFRALAAVSDAAKIGAILHCAAQVNHVYPYEALMEANVGATYRLLKFAKENGVAKFIQIGSMSSVIPAQGLKKCTGYDLSKGAAEQLVASARAKGLNATVVRLPLICSPHIALNPQDHFSCRIQDCLTRKFRPETGDKVAAVDTNDCAVVLVQMLKSIEAFQSKYDFLLDDGIAWNQIFEEVLSVELPALNYQDWRSQVLSDPAGPLSAFLSLYRDGAPFAENFLPSVRPDLEAERNFKSFIEHRRLNLLSSESVFRRVLRGRTL